jgi:hypothetical protein
LLRNCFVSTERGRTCRCCVSALSRGVEPGHSARLPQSLFSIRSHASDNIPGALVLRRHDNRGRVAIRTPCADAARPAVRLRREPGPEAPSRRAGCSGRRAPRGMRRRTRHRRSSPRRGPRGSGRASGARLAESGAGPVPRSGSLARGARRGWAVRARAALSRRRAGFRARSLVGRAWMSPRDGTWFSRRFVIGSDGCEGFCCFSCWSGWSLSRSRTQPSTFEASIRLCAPAER